MIILSGNPKSTQHIYKYTCRGKFGQMYMTKEGKDILAKYQAETKKQWNKPPIKGGLSLKVILYFGDKRTRDIDNYNKISLDSLTGIVYEDDSQINKLTIIKDYCKSDPRIEIYESKE